MEIVGLKKFVQDDINKLIAKFVGVKPHPIAKLLKDAELYYVHMRQSMPWPREILYNRKCEILDFIVKQLCDLQALNSKKRRETFAQLPKWVKTELLYGRCRVLSLFEKPKINRNFIIEQKMELGVVNRRLLRT